MNDYNDWLNKPLVVSTFSILLTSGLNYLINASKINRLEKENKEFKQEIKNNKKEAKDNQRSQDEKIYALTEKLNDRLIKEVEAKKDLENEVREIKDSLEWSRTFHDHEKKDKEKFYKDKEELSKKYWQLRHLLVVYCGLSNKDIDKAVDGNLLSTDKWLKKPKVQRLIKKLTDKISE